jgi:EgtB-related family protein
MPPETVVDQRWATARRLRTGDASTLADGLRASRARTLALLAAYEAALGPGLTVPYSPQMNPPLWEAGHIGWFQDWWIARNRQRTSGIACEPDHARPVGRLPGADALFDSSHVEHATRWHLPLPHPVATRDFLAAGLAETVSLLAQEDTSDDALYFYRLALFHEDMHAEAATYMAQALGIALPPALQPIERTLPAAKSLYLPGGPWRLGHDGPGFAFDNELAAHSVNLAPFEIDSVPVSWARYLPCVEDGQIAPPRYLRRVDGAWQRQRFGQWQPLDMDAPAVHLTYTEADRWCRWAGRRLPSEAEWEAAAMSDAAMHWGDVWEWTASPFQPYPGFVPHPYRDYSQPWFDGRPVLRGASAATSPRMVHPRYRNYFTPERNDIYAGFRSCGGVS